MNGKSPIAPDDAGPSASDMSIPRSRSKVHGAYPDHRYTKKPGASSPVLIRVYYP